MAIEWKKTVLAAVLAVGSSIGAVSVAQAGEEPGPEIDEHTHEYIPHQPDPHNHITENHTHINQQPLVSSGEDENYNCATKFEGNKKNTEWLCKDKKTGAYVNEDSMGLTAAMNVVIQDQYAVFKRSKSDKAILHTRLRVDSGGNVVQAVNEMKTSSPSMDKYRVKAPKNNP